MAGRTRQTGLPSKGGWNKPPKGMGTVNVRGVVMAVYFGDGEDRTSIEGSQFENNAVAADVLTYGKSYRYFLPRVPVMQTRHALNDHAQLWIPRPTTVDLSTGLPPVLPLSTFNRATGHQIADPNSRQPVDARNFDGDHVIITFLDNDPLQPVILNAQIPHPRTTFRHEATQGEIQRSRFRGVIQEIDDSGNLVIDTTRANSGGVDASTGEETPAADATHGNVTVKVNRNAEHTIIGVDDEDGNETFRLRIKDGEMLVRLSNGESMLITGSGGGTVTTLGDGAVSAAIAENLEALWESFLVYMNTTLSVPTGMGPSGPALTPPPAWAAAIVADKLKFPGN